MKKQPRDHGGLTIRQRLVKTYGRKIADDVRRMDELAKLRGAAAIAKRK